MNVPKITYTIPCICDKFISRYLYTLWKYSPLDSFRVIVMDQTKNGFRPEVMNYIRPLVHLYMWPHRNLGYAKSVNEMVIHALRWGSEFICVSNDDIELINRRWLDGIWQTFALDPQRIMGVVPMTTKVPGWGYNVPYDPELLPYKEEYTEADYDFLLNGDFTNVKTELPKTFPKSGIKGTVVDGSIFTMPYFKREIFEKVGLFDERFFPGSGEDMDLMARAYKMNYRIVATSYSWVWHHLSSSKDLFASGELEDPYYKNRPYWNNMGDIWPNGHDPWGYRMNEKGEKEWLPRVPEVAIEDI